MLRQLRAKTSHVVRLACFAIGALVAMLLAADDATAQALRYNLVASANRTGFGDSIAIGDVNFDGKGDIAIGAPSEDLDGEYVADHERHGRAYVYSGSSPSSSGTQLFVLNTSDPQANATYGFGYSIAVGDVNNDTKADIAVGAPQEDVNGTSDQGRVYVFSGANGQLIHTLTTDTAQVGAEFGWSVAIGKVNADDYADIVVGAYEETVPVNGIDNDEQGRVYVFSGLDYTSLGTYTVPSPGQAGAHFGHSVAVGLIDTDAAADIVIGAPLDKIGVVRVGKVYAFSGATGALTHTLSAPIHHQQANATFGLSVAIGKVNADGVGDIAVGAPQEDVGSITDQGQAYVFSGADASVVYNFTTPNPQVAAPSGFARVLALGNVDSDQRADLAVGANDEIVGSGALLNAAQGRSYVFSGADGHILYRVTPQFQPHPTPPPPAPYFPEERLAGAYSGWSVALGDIDGYPNYKADLAVGNWSAVPTSWPVPGRVFVWTGDCVYDLNNDTKVTFADLLLFSAASGSFHTTGYPTNTPPHPKWNPQADFNVDGKVDAAADSPDGLLFYAHYNQNPCVP